MAEKRDMTGVLFKNDRKEKDTHPDYTGNATIHGKDFWISAWVKTSSKGTKFFSFAFKPKEDYTPAKKYLGEDAATVLDDEIPF